MKTADTINELLKILLKQLHSKAKEVLNADEKSTPHDQMLHSVLDSGISSSGVAPKSQQKPQKK